ncbi:MAG: J domain-containing protein [Rhodoferax sp.]|uniref:J domain-containing protein n=1 Tax=Rhodoferax sp. TaxID=50421 RepID=UPI001401993A|nr:J domain-containing protein [Rhodoferax sp.]NDP38069.1 J domain-containing protein [Rhodoferax sp.]
MKPEATLYEILEVSPHASAQVIRAAYRCLAQSNHPDKNCGSEAASERQVQINFAYGVLSDARKRRRYDQRMGTQQVSDIERRGTDMAAPAHSKAMNDAPPVSRAFAFRPFK